MSRVSKIILMLLIVILAISSYFFIKELVKNKKETDVFDDLQEIVENTEKTTNENPFTDDLKEDESNISSQNTYNLEYIASINSDVIGWIKIDGTNINYPIMQNSDYYLHRDIYKKYSSHGTPYLANYCDVNNSDNLIIYGHHMKDNTMFSQLENYKNYNFYKDHKYVNIYTIKDGKTLENAYKVMIVFKTIAYSDAGFRYYSYTNFQNEEDYAEFVENCRNLEFYDTGITGTNKDKYITLSTCEYSQKNGRMVVVAKKE